MKLACLTFTSSGEKLAEKIKDSLSHEVDILYRSNYSCQGKSLRDSFQSIFTQYEGIIFVSSTGIAVRYIAPYVKDKTTDPAVIVVDDLGRYVISLLSGHLGGANDLANQVAEVINAVPIITTASDGRGIEAVDMLAKRLGLDIEDMKMAKVITSMMLEEKKIEIFRQHSSDIDLFKGRLDNIDSAIIISPYDTRFEDYIAIPICILRPKVLNIGIGCRKGKSVDEIMNAIKDIFKLNQLSINSVKAIATIDVKAKEAGIIEVSKKLCCDLKIFSSDRVREVQKHFKASDFVKQSIGVTSVSEPCAHLAGGRIIVNKTAIDGITVAVSMESYD